MIETILVGTLTAVAQALPGLIAGWSNHETDAEAIESLRRALSHVPRDPVHDAVVNWKARATAARSKP